MKKLHLSAPRVSKKVLLIAAGTLLILALLAVGAVSQVRQERQNKAVAAQQAAKQAEVERGYKVKISALEQQVTALKADKTAACNNYAQLSTGAATKRLVVVPLAVHCQ